MCGAEDHCHERGSRMIILRKAPRVLLWFSAVVVLLLACLTAYHHIALVLEKNKLTPPGTMVTVDGYKMHIYAEGEKNDKPTLVFMSGHGTMDPAYDFKVLYSKLSDEYRIVVIERFGYGYSDDSGLPRDVATEVRQSREALALAGEVGPFVLMPHSQSGIATIYWADQYPDEIDAIVLLDAVLPFEADPNTPTYKYTAERGMKFCGLFRIYYPKYGVDSYTKEEAKQRAYIINRNAFSKDMIEEEACKVDNIAIVNGLEPLQVPILAFSTPLFREMTISYAEKAADMQIVELDCDHFIHYFESTQIAEKTKTFLKMLW